MTDLSHWAQNSVGRRRSPGPRLKFAAPRLNLSPLLGWIVPLGLLAAWYGATTAQLVPEQILPRPAMVAQAFSTLAADGQLLENLTISLSRVACGFVGGALAGLLVGAGMAFSDAFDRAVRPTFLIVAQIPILAWLPFLMLLLGIGETLKVVLVAKAVFTPMTLSTCTGIRGVPARYLEVSRILGLHRWQVIRRVVFPSAVPHLFAGFRYGLTHAWMALVAVELLASYEGVGYLMVYSRQLFQLDVMVAVMLVIGAIGLVFDKFLSLGETRLARRYGRVS